MDKQLVDESLALFLKLYSLKTAPVYQVKNQIKLIALANRAYFRHDRRLKAWVEGLLTSSWQVQK